MGHNLMYALLGIMRLYPTLCLRKPCMLPETENSTSENIWQQYLDSAEVAGSIGAVQGVSTVVTLQALLLTAPPHLPLLVPAGATPAYNTAVVIHIPCLILVLLIPAGRKAAYITAIVILIPLSTLATARPSCNNTCLQHCRCSSHPVPDRCQ